METSEMERKTPDSSMDFEFAGDASAAQEILEIEGEVRDITIIPPCILNCLYPRALKNGCAHSNYVCFCHEISPALVNPEVQLCLQQCPFLGEQLVAQGSIMDFCGVDGLDIVFPQSMSQYGIHHRRAITSGGVSQSASHMIPLATPYKTMISTLPWGSSPYYYTQPEGDDGTVTVFYEPADTSISITHYITTTIPSGQAEYTSFFTDTKSAVITEVIAVTSGGTPQPTSPTTLNSPGSSGLSSEAKIGIAVTVPIVFILLILALIFSLRKRKRQPSPEHQEGYNRLAEPISNISELKGNTPSFPGEKKDLHVEAEGALIHEMSATVAELRSEADGNLRIKTQNDLAAIPAQREPLPKQTAPVPAKTTTTSFPQPWNNTEAVEYEYPQQLNQTQGVAIEDPEIAQLEEEAARMKKKRERLQEMQELEEREEELRRSIWERKKAAASGT